MICLMEIGCGMRSIHCTSLKIVAFLIKGLGVLRMAGLICSTPNGDGNPSTATCPGSPFFKKNLFNILVNVRSLRLHFISSSFVSDNYNVAPVFVWKLSFKCIYIYIYIYMLANSNGWDLWYSKDTLICWKILSCSLVDKPCRVLIRKPLHDEDKWILLLSMSRFYLENVFVKRRRKKFLGKFSLQMIWKPRVFCL